MAWTVPRECLPVLSKHFGVLTELTDVTGTCTENTTELTDVQGTCIETDREFRSIGYRVLTLSKY